MVHITEPLVVFLDVEIIRKLEKRDELLYGQ